MVPLAPCTRRMHLALHIPLTAPARVVGEGMGTLGEKDAVSGVALLARPRSKGLGPPQRRRRR